MACARLFFPWLSMTWLLWISATALGAATEFDNETSFTFESGMFFTPQPVNNEPLPDPASHIQHAIRQGKVKPFGVSLGGWLVAEYDLSWSSPLWRNVPESIRTKGEFYTMLHLGHERGDARFEQHRGTWITEQDIVEIAQSGLNTVRVPAGYWMMADNSTVKDPMSNVFAPGSLKYLDLLINVWARRYDLAVLVSFHAHKGSQNGRDHSAPSTANTKMWSSRPENIDHSYQFAVFLAKRYQNAPAFLGLSLMNEPEYPTNPVVVQEYFTRVYKQVRLKDKNDCILVTSPMISEQIPPFMMEFMRGTGFVNVWHDWHLNWRQGYEGKTDDQLINLAVMYGETLRKWTGNPILVGEWSMATNEVDAPFKDLPKYQRFGIGIQSSLRLARGGWIFWTWRHADDGDGNKRSGWSLRSLLRTRALYV